MNAETAARLQQIRELDPKRLVESLRYNDPRGKWVVSCEGGFHTIPQVQLAADYIEHLLVQIERIRKYAVHKPECACIVPGGTSAWVEPNAAWQGDQAVCTCGLRAILEAETPP